MAELDEKVAVVIIGGGVVGCAVAHSLSSFGMEPWVLESGPRIAEGTTSRNSGVIHAGIYYPKASLKAESCIRGNALVYEWCEKLGVPHARTGKWIVGRNQDEASLTELYENAQTCGATGLEWRSSRDGLPEQVIADIAIYSARTGIVDPYSLSRSLQEQSEAAGAMFLMDTPVLGIERLIGGDYQIETSRGPIRAECIVNCAGLHADDVARMVGIDRYRIYPCRGDYFRLRSSTRFSSLIYPVKRKGSPGLGIHLTLALDGSLRLGPDTEYISSKEDFSDDPDKRQKFFEAASGYLTGLKVEDLSYDSCGIRPKLRSPKDLDEKDFVLSQDLPGFINLMGIESPGLTASLDLAERVAQLLS